MRNTINIPDDIYESLGMTKPVPEDEIEETPKYQNGDDAHYLREATKEFPKFIRVHGKDLNGVLVACTGVREETMELSKCETETYDAAHVRILEGEHKSEGRSIKLRDLTVDELYDANDELNKLYKDVTNSITCEIRTRIYPEAVLSNSLNHYEMYTRRLDEIGEHVYKPEDAHSLEDAQVWLMKNHPQEWIGHSVSVSNGDLSFGAIPQAYDESNDKIRWNTREGREEIIREQAKYMESWYPEVGKVEVGTFDWSELDRLTAEKHDEIAASIAKQGGIRLREKGEAGFTDDLLASEDEKAHAKERLVKLIDRQDGTNIKNTREYKICKEMEAESEAKKTEHIPSAAEKKIMRQFGGEDEAPEASDEFTKY